MKAVFGCPSSSVRYYKAAEAQNRTRIFSARWIAPGVYDPRSPRAKQVIMQVCISPHFGVICERLSILRSAVGWLVLEFFRERPSPLHAGDPLLRCARSEERRVGKERRSPGSRDH